MHLSRISEVYPNGVGSCQPDLRALLVSGAQSQGSAACLYGIKGDGSYHNGGMYIQTQWSGYDSDQMDA